MRLKTGLFFDGANHHAAMKKLSFDIDYKAMLTGLSKVYDVVTARYYTGLSPQPEHEQLHRKVDWLSHNGFTVITKPVKISRNGTVKADMDIEIAVDMVLFSLKLDQIILFSGDGDFRYAVEAVQKLGVKVTIISIPELASFELLEQADGFVDIRKLGVKQGVAA